MVRHGAVAAALPLLLFAEPTATAQVSDCRIDIAAGHCGDGPLAQDERVSNPFRLKCP